MEFNATNIFLLIINILAFLFVIYNDLLLPFLRGKTILTIKLRSRGRADGYLFIGIIAIMFITNTFYRDGERATSILLLIMGLLFIYISFIRGRKVIFKKTGFYHALLFFSYASIERINVSEDGFLVLENGKQRLMLPTRSETDLKKMIATIETYRKKSK